MTDALAQLLHTGLTELELDLPPGAEAGLMRYLDLMQRWNKTYNLTAIRDAREMVIQHLLDSLAVLPFLEKSVAVGRRLRVADIGSGAGLPGIPLALARPDWQVALVEAVEKKSAFQRQVKIELGLANVHVAGSRVELMAPAQHDLVISRAFASLADFIGLAGHLLDEGGCLCAMKGVMPDQEIHALPDGWMVADVVPLQVPSLDAQRHVLLLRKS